MTEEVNTEKAFVDKFADRAKEQTLESLPAFLQEMADSPHDYGTICHAVALGAFAAACAMDRSPQGGITGFQAGAITWEFIRHWNPSLIGSCGARMINYENMLYPQYEQKFMEHTITRDCMEELQKRAAEKLSEIEDLGHVILPSVVEHWRSIVDGKVPFGYKVAE